MTYNRYDINTAANWYKNHPECVDDRADNNILCDCSINRDPTRDDNYSDIIIKDILHINCQAKATSRSLLHSQNCPTSLCLYDLDWCEMIKKIKINNYIK